MTKVDNLDTDMTDRPAQEIEITPEMIEAGAERLQSVLGCGGATYVAEEVYRAMVARRPKRTVEGVVANWGFGWFSGHS